MALWRVWIASSGVSRVTRVPMRIVSLTIGVVVVGIVGHLYIGGREKKKGEENRTGNQMSQEHRDVTSSYVKEGRRVESQGTLAA